MNNNGYLHGTLNNLQITSLQHPLHLQSVTKACDFTLEQTPEPINSSPSLLTLPVFHLDHCDRYNYFPSIQIFPL